MKRNIYTALELTNALLTKFVSATSYDWVREVVKTDGALEIRGIESSIGRLNGHKFRLYAAELRY